MKQVHVGRIVHRALRGRYVIAVALGVICGGIAGGAAWRLGYPIYQSQGLIRIANARPIVERHIDTNGEMPLTEFDTFITTEKAVISSQRIIETAVMDPVWKAMGKSVPQPTDQFFAKNMKVESRPRSEIIQITVEDRDPGTAAAAVTSVIDAFSDFYTSEEKRTERQVDGALLDKRDALKDQIKSLSEQVRADFQGFGGRNPDEACTDATKRVDELQVRLSAVQAALAVMPHPSVESPVPGKSSQGTTPAAPATTTPQTAAADADLTPEQLAATNARISTLLDEQARDEQEVRRLSARLGSAHPALVAARDTLQDIKDRVARQAALLNAARRIAPAAGAATVASATPGAPPTLLIGGSFVQLKETEASLTKQLDEAKQQLNAFAAQRLAIQQHQSDLKGAQDELKAILDRIDARQTERVVGGRLTVIASGNVPISPARDIRPRLAAGAGLGGLLTPAGLIVLYSLMRRKYRYADDTEHDGAGQAVPLLGILPELRSNDSDIDRLASASHCVHQIRVSLNAATARGAGPRAFLVTSATAGEGKTTVTMSLGLSFAASRVRTLIIDADLVGRKLTGAFGARDAEGLHESIAAGTIRQRVRRTDSGLYVLTAGKAGASDACAIPKAAIRAVIAEARNYFDVILVDSGPIMGSLEASTVASEVDGVIFAITRGQNRQAADAAMRRLRGLGAHVVGCVFNRAKAADLDHSSYGSSSRLSLPDPHQPARLVKPLVGEGFGPVVQAVAAAMPESQN